MYTVKLYNDFERDVRPDYNVGKDSRSIIQYGFPGSGSTFIWQALSALFPNVKKTHVCPDYRECDLVVATLRDFRDVLCTYLARANLPADKGSIDFLVHVHASGIEAFADLDKVEATWRGKKNILWLRYEDFAGEFDYLFAAFSEFFEMEISAEQRARIRDNYSVEANRKRAEAAGAMCRQNGADGWLDKTWVRYTIDGINGLHITNGGVGKWRQVIPEHLHSYVTEKVRGPLEKFGYL